MSANQPTKTAAISTPAVAPAGSPPEVEKLPNAAAGAAPEEDGPYDIMGALNERSDRSKQPEGEADEEATPAAETSATEETPAEVPPTAEAEAEDAPTGEDAPATAASEDKTEPEKPEEKTALQKRFDELTAQRHELETNLAKARERLASYDAAAVGSLEPTALEQIDSLETLHQHRIQLLRDHQWAMTHPEGGDKPTRDGKPPVPYGPEEVRALLSLTFEGINEHVPAREKFLIARETMDAAAVNAYPWLKDTRNGLGAQVQNLIETTPALRRLGPSYRTIAADALIGQTLRDAGVNVDGKLVERLKSEAAKGKPDAGKASAATPPAVRRMPPAAPARPGTVPPRVAPREAQSRASQKALSKGDGNVNAIAAAIAAKF